MILNKCVEGPLNVFFLAGFVFPKGNISRSKKHQLRALTHGKNVRQRLLRERFTRGIEAGSLYRSLHVGPIL